VKVEGWNLKRTRRRYPETLFEPNPEVILGYLLSRYVNIYIYQALQNAKASEQSARMVSMKNATDNAEDLIKDLTSNTISFVRTISLRSCWKSPAARPLSQNDTQRCH